MSGARRPPAAEGLAVPSRSLTLALLILGTATRGAVAVASGRWPQPGGEQPLEPALLLDAGHLREVQAMVSEGRADDARRFGQVAAALAEDIHDIDGLLSAGSVVASEPSGAMPGLPLVIQKAVAQQDSPLVQAGILAQSGGTTPAATPTELLVGSEGSDPGATSANAGESAASVASTSSGLASIILLVVAGVLAAGVLVTCVVACWRRMGGSASKAAEAAGPDDTAPPRDELAEVWVVRQKDARGSVGSNPRGSFAGGSSPPPTRGSLG